MRHSILMSLCLAAFCVLASACTLQSASRESGGGGEPELANRVYALFKDKCWSCHGEPGKRVRGQKGKLDYILDYDRLIEEKLLDPGNLESKVCTEVASGAMPMEYDPATRKMYEVKMPQESINLVLDWVKAGAPRWNADAEIRPAAAGLHWQELKDRPPAPRFGMAMAQGPKNTLVTFGGETAQGFCAETWVFSEGAWALATPKNSPVSEASGKMVFDSKRGVTVLVCGDMTVWEWDGTDWKNATPKNRPPQRLDFALAFDERYGFTVLYGGLDAAERIYYDDFWTFDGKEFRLVQLYGPDARAGAALCWSAANNALLLFGGRNWYGTFSDTWLFDGRTWTPQTPLNTPSASENLLTAASHQAFLVCSSPADDSSATWLWNGRNWLRVPEQPKAPKARFGAALAFDKASASMILFGGMHGTEPLNDAWSLAATK